MMKSETRLGNNILKLTGTVSFRNASDGVREIVLRATNNTKSSIWVPNSHGRGIIGCEAVNLKEEGSLKSIHYDHALCRFPDQYIRLKPGETCEYVYAIPNDYQGDIKISVWAPLRTDKGDFLAKGTKKAALKNGDILIEEVDGIGHLSPDGSHASPTTNKVTGAERDREPHR